MANASGKRVNFSLIKDKYAKMGKGNVRLTQSSLFLTKDIDPTKSTYDFDTLENQQGTLQGDEIRLNINDEFIVSHMGIFLYGTWTADNQGVKIGTAPQLLTYAPLEIGADTINSKGLYAGQLKIAVNNIVFLEKWDLRKHELVTRTQFAGFAKATTASNDFHSDGMIEMSPLLTLSGSKKNDITIRLPLSISPSKANFINDAGETITVNITKIAVKMFGLNAQNAAKFQ